jgi:L-alanine-DL-glutamate epimerase-like enolase superfamily enzyme
MPPGRCRWAPPVEEGKNYGARLRSSAAIPGPQCYWAAGPDAIGIAPLPQLDPRLILQEHARTKEEFMTVPKLKTKSDAARVSARSGHRIVGVKAHCLRLPYRGEVKFASVAQSSAEYSLLVLRLDDGTEGIAEAVCRPEHSGEDARALAYQFETFFKPLLIGTDPLENIATLDKLEHIRGCRAAKSLIDIALWDLRGKLLGQPVWRLLGGGPAKPVPLTWVAHGNSRQAQVDEAKRMVLEQGYKGLKLKVWRRNAEDVALVRDVRQAVGDDVMIYVDANNRYTETESRTVLGRIADHNVAFIEDPCVVSDLGRMALLAQALPIAVLGDSGCNTLKAVHAHIRADAVGAVSVKLRRTGYAESLKIIALCEAAGLAAVIGTDSESRIGAMARAHLRMAIPSMAPWPIETHFFDKLGADVFAGEFGLKDGTIAPTDAPGFGAAIDARALERFSF